MERATCSTVIAQAKNEAVVVLGMHRSGTSLCMNVLQALGIRLDKDLIPGDANNPAGYFESRKLVALNENILHTLGAKWHTPFSLAMPPGWVDTPALLPTKRALRKLVTRKVASGRGTWGFKDPRTSVLLPLYEQVFAECGVQPRYILCLRDPRTVAASLRNRDQIPAALSEVLWLDYTMPVVQFAGNRLRCVIQYEKWFQDGVSQADSLACAIGSEASPAALDEMVQRIVAPVLNDASAAGDFELPCTRAVYKLLLSGDLPGAVVAYAEASESNRLAIELSVSQPATAQVKKQKSAHAGNLTSQLFWRQEGGEFNEAASTRRVTRDSPARRKVRLDIPAGLGPRPRFRFDLADSAGIAQLFGMRLLDGEGTPIWEWDGKPSTLNALDRRQLTVLEAAGEPGVFLFLPTRDPMLLLPECTESGRLSQSGGFLEFDYCWRGTIDTASQ